MGNLNDETQDTFTGVAVDAQSGTTELETGGSDSVVIFIDDGSDNAPADSTLVLERYSENTDRWMEYSRVDLSGSTDPESVTSESVPNKMRGSVINDSAGSADFRLNMVSY